MSGTDAEDNPTAAELTAPVISLPPGRRYSNEERHRRRELYEQTKMLRKEIGPIDIPTYELVREGRDG